MSTHREDGSALAGGLLVPRHEVYAYAEGVDKHLLPQGRLEESVPGGVDLGQRG